MSSRNEQCNQLQQQLLFGLYLPLPTRDSPSRAWAKSVLGVPVCVSVLWKERVGVGVQRGQPKKEMHALRTTV